MTDEELTALYNEANKLDPKRHNPITTERIFAAMRAAYAEGYDKGRTEGLREAADRCREEGHSLCDATELAAAIERLLEKP